MFKLFGAFGADGPSVETVLTGAHLLPGDTLHGEIHLRGGGHDAHVEQVTLAFVAVVEVGDDAGEAAREFHRWAVTGPFTLPAGQSVTVPFALPTPWELPVGTVYGQPLHGTTLAVRTELEISGAVDQGDLDAVTVGPLASQQRVLDAFATLGFHFTGADLEEGYLSGVAQELPFYQEIEFAPPGEYAGRISEVELTFVASPHGLTVVLEADGASDDVYGRFALSHDEALYHPWEQSLTNWLHAAAGHSHGHGDGHGHSGGPGWGGVAAAGVGGVAAGAAVGYLASEALSDDDEEEDEPENVVGDVQAVIDQATAAAYQEAYEDAIEEAVEEAYEDAYEEAYEEATEEFADD